MPRRPELSSHSERAVRDFVDRAASRAERVVSIGRCLLLTASLVRSLALWSTWNEPVARAWPAALVVGVGIAVSLWIVIRLGRRPATPKLLWLSVTLDSLLLFAALIATPLFPGPDYPGILLMADLALVGIVTIIGGLRLLPGAAAWGSFLNTVSLVTVIWVDHALHGLTLAPAGARLVQFGIIQAAGIAIAMVVSVRTRRLVLEGARHAVQAELAEHQLGSLMRDHHDVRTLLSSAALNADMVARQLRGERAGDREELSEVANELTESLARVNEFVAAIRERAFDELAALHDPAAVTVGDLMEAVAGEARPQFPDTEIRVRDVSDGAKAWIAGGEAVLQRVLRNLVVNACEGDGRASASRVELRALLGPDSECVVVRVSDDGPGFPASVLEAPAGGRATTKPAGSGLGLLMVAALLGSASDTLERGNGPEGGAVVSFELPLSSPPPS